MLYRRVYRLVGERILVDLLPLYLDRLLLDIKDFFVIEGSISSLRWLNLFIPHQDFFASPWRSLETAVIDLLKLLKNLVYSLYRVDVLFNFSIFFWDLERLVAKRTCLRRILVYLESLVWVYLRLRVVLLAVVVLLLRGDFHVFILSLCSTKPRRCGFPEKLLLVQDCVAKFLKEDLIRHDLTNSISENPILEKLVDWRSRLYIDLE